MSSRKNIGNKSDDPRKVRNDFAEHMRREYFSNHVFRGTTVLLSWHRRTLHIEVPRERDW